MVATFEQVFLKPGIIKGRRITADDIRSYVDGTKRMMAEGYRPPVLFEHAAPGSDEGAPRPRDTKAAEVKHGAGWVTDVKVNSDGAAAYVLQVTDDTAAKKLREQSIRFTSPELRPAGFGKWNYPVIAHAALTHRPEAINQGEIKPVETLQLSACTDPIQLSLEDWEEDMNEEEDKKPEAEETAPEAPETENPDAPKDSAGEQQFQALLQQLEVIGVSLPSDATEDTLVRDLLGALKTYAAAKAAIKAEEEAKNADVGELDPKEEKAPPMQFSVSDCDTEGKVPSLVAKLIRVNHSELGRKLEKLVSEHQITPGLAKSLNRAEVLQFSAEADELPSFTLGQVVDLLAEHTVPGLAFGDTFQLSVGEPPVELSGGDLSPEAAKKFVDQQAQHIPMLRK